MKALTVGQRCRRIGNTRTVELLEQKDAICAGGRLAESTGALLLVTPTEVSFLSVGHQLNNFQPKDCG
jgi:hypothetical protein